MVVLLAFVILILYDVKQGTAAGVTYTQGDDGVSDEYGNDFVTISDEDGNEFELEHLDTVEQGGKFYMAFLPADLDEDDEDYGLIILRMTQVDGEEVLTTLDDDDELNEIYECFIERLSDDIDEDIDNDIDDEED